MLKRLLAIFFAAALLLSCTLTTFSTGDSDPFVLSEEMQKKENVAIEKYNKMLQAWAGDRVYFSDMDVDFPDFYGGAYLNDRKDFVIQVTSLDKGTIKYFSEIIDVDDVVFEEVKYSYLRLNKEYDAIVDLLDADTNNSQIKNITGIGISCSENSVNLYIVSDEKNENIRDSFTKEVKKAVTSFENVNIIITDEYSSTNADLQPGTLISTTGSVGFWATKGTGSNMQYGIVTHGHGITSGQTISVGSLFFGYAGTPVYSGSVDATFVPHTGNTSIITKSRFVSGYDFNHYSGAYSTVILGTTVYSKGSMSGCFSGNVTAIPFTAVYPDRTLTDMVLTSARSSGGDSGGIVAAGGTSTQRYIVGIHSGTSGGTQVFCKAGNLITALGVSPY